MNELRQLVARNRAGAAEAMPSVCSAHRDVLTAAMLLAKDAGAPLLVEATSNQVNQFGGYTGMTPRDFIVYVHSIGEACGVQPSSILFGGDHLGPQAWRSEPAESAMAKAHVLVAEYVKAGFTKIHLDCAEGCAGEPDQIGDDLAAMRAAALAAACEEAAPDPEELSYVVGTEVPPPGGANAFDISGTITPTTPESARATIAAHEKAFAAQGISTSAWARTRGLVVQPGLEYAPEHIYRFDAEAADILSPVLDLHPGLCFEAHSTDYQSNDVFPALARRHFAVLKVGPALTYAYRRAIYALDAIAGWLTDDPHRGSVASVMEALMGELPQHWVRHYSGSGETLRLLRHFSYSDRIRYYWPHPRAREAVERLFALLADKTLPLFILEQYFCSPVLSRADALRDRVVDAAKALVLAQIQQAIAPYFACYGAHR